MKNPKPLTHPINNKSLRLSDRASHHFWLESISALVLIPLVIWLCISIVLLPEVSYKVATLWLQSPFNSVMMILLLVIAFQHAQLGIQVILDDYIASLSLRLSLLFIVKLISYFLTVIGVISIISIAIGS